ncbi:DUF1499 domain-containing protein [Mesorhizobium sp. CAU 1741]|uniref:DUF1499 domain-containing protein n=1 Tax=Mesorhizobium sp. CAU 1741 TaxID=3140366 RepID=UPI00325B60A6
MTTMRLFQERRVSAAAQWARSVSAFSAVLALTAAVGHRYGMVDTLAFIWVELLAAALAMIGLLLAIVGFRRLWVEGDVAGRASALAVVLSVLVLAPFTAAGYFAFRYPPLNDISTDLSEPPIFVFAPRDRTGQMNPITPITAAEAELQRAGYPEVRGRRFDASMERVLDAIEVVVATRGWMPRAPLPDTLPMAAELSIEVQAPTLLVRLPADAVIRLTDEGESVFVDMRMSSRYGAHDLGDNARRIRGFLDEVDAEFTRQSLSIIDIPASTEEEDPVE